MCFPHSKYQQVKLAGMGRNQVYGASCSAQTAHKNVSKNSAKQALKAYCPNIYTVVEIFQVVVAPFDSQPRLRVSSFCYL